METKRFRLIISNDKRKNFGIGLLQMVRALLEQNLIVYKHIMAKFFRLSFFHLFSCFLYDIPNKHTQIKPLMTDNRLQIFLNQVFETKKMLMYQLKFLLDVLKVKEYVYFLFIVGFLAKISSKSTQYAAYSKGRLMS